MTFTLSAQVSAQRLFADQAPNPTPTAPPGSENFLTVLNWGMWAILIIGVLGFMIAGGMMILQHRNGQMGEHGSRLGMIMIGCIVAASASGLVNMLI